MPEMTMRTRERIAKLLVLAKHHRTPIAEAQAAFNRAKALLDKYGVTYPGMKRGTGVKATRWYVVERAPSTLVSSICYGELPDHKLSGVVPRERVVVVPLDDGDERSLVALDAAFGAVP